MSVGLFLCAGYFAAAFFCEIGIRVFELQYWMYATCVRVTEHADFELCTSVICLLFYTVCRRNLEYGCSVRRLDVLLGSPTHSQPM